MQERSACHTLAHPLPIQADTHMCSCTSKHKHTSTCKHKEAHRHSLSHTQAHAHIQTYAHAYTRTHKHMHKHIRTCMHTQAENKILSSVLWAINTRDIEALSLGPFESHFPCYAWLDAGPGHSTQCSGLSFCRISTKRTEIRLTKLSNPVKLLGRKERRKYRPPIKDTHTRRRREQDTSFFSLCDLIFGKDQCQHESHDPQEDNECFVWIR